MHDFNGLKLKRRPTSVLKLMYKEKRRLVMINGYINENKENVIAYNFDVNGDITTYLVKGEEVLPSITPIYSASARWAEEEIEEMMNMKFEGLDRSGRLFLPEEFKDGWQDKILVMPLSELKKYKDK